MKTIWDVLKGPVITEKALKLKESERGSGSTGPSPSASQWMRTSTRSNTAVETIFKVKVLDVRIINYHGKEVRRGRTIGRKPDWKKAYVTLRRGERDIDYGDSI